MINQLDATELMLKTVYNSGCKKENLWHWLDFIPTDNNKFNIGDKVKLKKSIINWFIKNINIYGDESKKALKFWKSKNLDKKSFIITRYGSLDINGLKFVFIEMNNEYSCYLDEKDLIKVK
jgi:hypothetical protein